MFDFLTERVIFYFQELLAKALSILPTGELPMKEEIITGGQYLVAYMKVFDGFMPITEMLNLLLIYVGFELSLMAISGTFFMINYFRGR